jgi:hypothetical protein
MTSDEIGRLHAQFLVDCGNEEHITRQTDGNVNITDKGKQTFSQFVESITKQPGWQEFMIQNFVTAISNFFVVSQSEQLKICTTIMEFYNRFSKLFGPFDAMYLLDPSTIDRHKFETDTKIWTYRNYEYYISIVQQSNLTERIKNNIVSGLIKRIEETGIKNRGGYDGSLTITDYKNTQRRTLMDYIVTDTTNTITVDGSIETPDSTTDYIEFRNAKHNDTLTDTKFVESKLDYLTELIKIWVSTGPKTDGAIQAYQKFKQIHDQKYGFNRGFYLETLPMCSIVSRLHVTNTDYFLVGDSRWTFISNENLPRLWEVMTYVLIRGLNYSPKDVLIENLLDRVTRFQLFQTLTTQFSATGAFVTMFVNAMTNNQTTKNNLGLAFLNQFNSENINYLVNNNNKIENVKAGLFIVIKNTIGLGWTNQKISEVVEQFDSNISSLFDDSDSLERFGVYIDSWHGDEFQLPPLEHPLKHSSGYPLFTHHSIPDPINQEYFQTEKLKIIGNDDFLLLTGDSMQIDTTTVLNRVEYSVIEPQTKFLIQWISTEMPSYVGPRICLFVLQLLLSFGPEKIQTFTRMLIPGIGEFLSNPKNWNGVYESWNNSGRPTDTNHEFFGSTQVVKFSERLLKFLENFVRLDPTQWSKIQFMSTGKQLAGKVSSKLMMEYRAAELLLCMIAQIKSNDVNEQFMEIILSKINETRQRLGLEKPNSMEYYLGIKTKSEIDQLTTKWENGQMELNQARFEIERRNQEIQKLQSIVQQIQQTLVIEKQNSENVQQQLLIQQQKIQELEQSEVNATTEIDGLRNQMANQQKQLMEFDKTHDQKLEELKEATQNLDQAVSELNLLKIRVNDLETELKFLYRSIQKLTPEVDKIIIRQDPKLLFSQKLYGEVLDVYMLGGLDEVINALDTTIARAPEDLKKEFGSFVKNSKMFFVSQHEFDENVASSKSNDARNYYDTILNLCESKLEFGSYGNCVQRASLNLKRFYLPVLKQKKQLTPDENKIKMFLETFFPVIPFDG